MSSEIVWQTDSVYVFTSLLPPNSGHVMIHLRGYNCPVCILPLNQFLVTDWTIEQLQRPKWISRVWIGWQKYVITLIETVYWFGSLLLYEKQNAVIVVKSKMLITFSRLPYRRRHWKIVIVSFPLWINAQEYELNSG